MDEDGDVQKVRKVNNRREPAGSEIARISEDKDSFGELAAELQIISIRLHRRRSDDVGDRLAHARLLRNFQGLFFNRLRIVKVVEELNNRLIIQGHRLQSDSGKSGEYPVNPLT